MTGPRPRQRILLVDGFIDEREMYAEYFQTRGYCTLQASTARDGFQMAADLHPLVIVTDLKLAGYEDGLGLTARVKSDASTRDARVIVLSGYVFPADRAAAVKAGCDRFLEKPCAPAALEAVVCELVRHAHA